MLLPNDPPHELYNLHNIKTVEIEYFRRKIGPFESRGFKDYKEVQLLLRNRLTQSNNET